MIVLYDQISRNIYRRKKEAFAHDVLSVPLTLSLLPDRKDKQYKFFERIFLYLPLQHSEKMEEEDLSLKLFTELSEDYSKNTIMHSISKSFIGYAEDHWKIVKEFGRYPHRNDVLQRDSTEKEKEFLEKTGKRFGQ